MRKPAFTRRTRTVPLIPHVTGMVAVVVQPLVVAVADATPAVAWNTDDAGLILSNARPLIRK